jgi:gamma-butyrobetaine dioxygenase
MDPIDELEALFAGEGARDYLGEAVSQAAHMLQAAALAREAGSPPALVAAALLHDIGHFDSLVTGVGAGSVRQSTDVRHSDTGAEWLSRWFPAAVCEPVRLHVAAKRYLCAVEPGYAEQLSEASVHTLSLQGGPMSTGDAAAFAVHPFAADAVALRRFDERAKDPGRDVPGFEAYRSLLEGQRRLT